MNNLFNSTLMNREFMKLKNLLIFYTVCASYVLCSAMNADGIQLPDPEELLPKEMYLTMALNPVRPEVAAITSAGHLILWNLDDLSIITRFESPEKVTNEDSINGRCYRTCGASLSYHPNGNLIAAGQPHGVYFYNLETNERRCYQKRKHLPTALEFNHDGTKLVEGAAEGHIILHTVNSGQGIRYKVRGSSWDVFVPQKIKRGDRKNTMIIEFDGVNTIVEEWDFTNVTSLNDKPAKRVLDQYDQFTTNPLRNLSKRVQDTAIEAELTADRKRLVQLIALAQERYILVTDE
jgi:hypothetical protein